MTAPTPRAWTDADREFVRSALPTDPEDDGTIVTGYDWHQDGSRRYTVPRLGDPYEVVDRVLDALTAAGWRSPGQMAAMRHVAEGDHDARVRTDERARVAGEIAAAIERARDDRMVVTITDPVEMGRAAVWREAARLARQHATPPTTEGDHHAPTQP